MTAPNLNERQRAVLIALHENYERSIDIDDTRLGRTRDSRHNLVRKFEELGLVTTRSYSTTTTVSDGQVRPFTPAREKTAYVSRTSVEITPAGRELAESVGAERRQECVVPDCKQMVALDVPMGRCRYHGPNGRGKDEADRLIAADKDNG